MNIRVRHAIGMFALLSLVAGHAQPLGSASYGALGMRYGEIGFGQADPGDDRFERKKVGGLNLNLPVTNSVDLTFGGNVSSVKGSTVGGTLRSPPAEVSTRERTARVAATAHLRRGVVAPFARVSGSYTWSNEKLVVSSALYGTNRIERREQDAAWGLAAGAEIVAGRVAFTPALMFQNAYHNVFGHDVGRALGFGMSAHGWFTKQIGGFARVDYVQPRQDFTDRTWAWEAGVRLGF